MFGVSGSDQSGDLAPPGATDAVRGVWDAGSQPNILAGSQPATIVCNGRTPSGAVCGATAAVRRVHYKYTAKLIRRQGEFQQVLSEAQYDIACPRCGWRTQVETVDRT